MTKRQFWIWVDGQKRYYDYPPDPPGYTVEQCFWFYCMEQLAKMDKRVPGEASKP